MLVLLPSTLLATLAGLVPSSALLGPQTAQPADPGPRTKLAGMRNVVLDSRVTFRAEPDQPHRIRTTFSFPDRTRWWLAPETTTTRARRLRYGYGEHAYGLEPGSVASVEFTGIERLAALRQLALRRHTFLWPDSVEWTAGQGGERVAELGTVGRLVAQLGPDGAPVSVRSQDAAGEPSEELRPSEWTELAGRRWPMKLTFLARGEPIWDEELLEADTASLFVDVFFLPPDRRSGKSSRVDPDRGRVSAVDVPGFYFRRIVLRSPGTWDQALEQAEHLTRELGEGLPEGWSADPYPTLELSDQAQPTALLLRVVSSDAGGAPEGFERRPEEAALSLFLESPARLDARALQRLRAAAPAGLKGSAPYARVEPRGPAGNATRRVQLVYPLGDG